MRHWVALVSILFAALGGQRGACAYEARWSAERSPLRLALWTDDAAALAALGRWCEQRLSNLLHRHEFGGLAVTGGLRYQAAVEALTAGAHDVLEVDAAAYLLHDDAALAGGASSLYTPLLQRWGDGEASPALVLGPGIDARDIAGWRGLRVGLIDTWTSVGGLAQLEWLLAHGADFRNDIRFVVCGAPEDALARVRTGLVDAAAVPADMAASAALPDGATVLQTSVPLLPRLWVIRADLPRWRPELVYELGEALRAGPGAGQLIAVKREYYAAEQERWTSLARRVFSPQRALLRR